MHEGTLKTAGIILILLISLLIMLLVWQNLARFQTEQQLAGLVTANQAVEKAVAHCYALEGAYPPDLAYLQVHYGLLLDEENYAVYYELIADNIFPIIDIQLIEDVWQ